MRNREDIKNDFYTATTGQCRDNVERRTVQKLFMETLLDIRDLLSLESKGNRLWGFAEPGDSERRHLNG